MLISLWDNVLNRHIVCKYEPLAMWNTMFDVLILSQTPVDKVISENLPSIQNIHDYIPNVTNNLKM
jgi:hypothetical protein